MTAKNYNGFDTLCLHGGHDVDKDTLSRAVPIYQTTSYLFKSSEHAADLFALKEFGNIYTRLMNPTTDVLEKRVALLEGGVAALAASSGMAAITLAVTNIAGQGDEIVASSSLYGGTHTLFHYTLPKLGINVKFADLDDLSTFENNITDKTKAVYIETIGNPKVNVADIESVADIAHNAGVPLIVDNTMASPYLTRPIDFGADIVVHSLTKFLGGHGSSIGGIIVDSGNFKWDNGKFPSFTEPDASYHGLKFYEAFGNVPGVGNIAYIVKARVQGLRDIGPCISPFNSFLIIQGIETLGLRVQRHSDNALKVAEFLEKHPKVIWVTYPGLSSSPYNELAKKYMPKGCGAIIGFGVKGGYKAGTKVIENVKLFSHLANICDARSLIIHPASTTHQQLSEEEQISAGATPDFIRLSIGIENVEDIINDLDNALKNI